MIDAIVRDALSLLAQPFVVRGRRTANDEWVVEHYEDNDDIPPSVCIVNRYSESADEHSRWKNRRGWYEGESLYYIPSRDRWFTSYRRGAWWHGGILTFSFEFFEFWEEWPQSRTTLPGQIVYGWSLTDAAEGVGQVLRRALIDAGRIDVASNESLDVVALATVLLQAKGDRR